MSPVWPEISTQIGGRHSSSHQNFKTAAYPSEIMNQISTAVSEYKYQRLFKCFHSMDNSTFT